MGYLLWFGIVLLIFALMHYFTALTSRQKGMISLMITLIIGNAIAYNLMKDAESKRLATIELKFNNGETLTCNSITVNNKNFTYSVGTQSFIGNESSRYSQQIISARECE